MKKQPNDVNKNQNDVGNQAIHLNKNSKDVYDIELAEEEKAMGEYAGTDQEVAKRQQEFVDIQTSRNYTNKQQ